MNRHFTKGWLRCKRHKTLYNPDFGCYHCNQERENVWFMLQSAAVALMFLSVILLGTWMYLGNF